MERKRKRLRICKCLKTHRTKNRKTALRQGKFLKKKIYNFQKNVKKNNNKKNTSEYQVTESKNLTSCSSFACLINVVKQSKKSKIVKFYH